MRCHDAVKLVSFQQVLTGGHGLKRSIQKLERFEDMFENRRVDLMLFLGHPKTDLTQFLFPKNKNLSSFQGGLGDLGLKRKFQNILIFQPSPLIPPIVISSL